MNFDQAFTELLGHEGGYVNHPLDPGGATNWGITQTVARQNGYTGNMETMTQATAKDIYSRMYWAPMRCDALPSEIRYAVFDAAVNSGVRQSTLWLQRAVNVGADGVIGPQTLAAVQACEPYYVLRRLLSQRLKFMTDLKTWPAFGRGWARRIADLMEGFS